MGDYSGLAGFGSGGFETVSVRKKKIRTTWDLALGSGVVLSEDGLTATNIATSSRSGVKVAAALAKTFGKFYFRITMGVQHDPSCAFGISTPEASFDALSVDGTGGIIFYSDGRIFAERSFVRPSFNGFAIGDTLDVAADLIIRKAWIKNICGPSAPSEWNGDSWEDPVTNRGGIGIIGGPIVPYCLFGGLPGSSFTAHFEGLEGVPFDFVPGWPR